MMSSFDDPKSVRRLAERLSKLPQVSKRSDGAHDEAWTLVHAFEDLEASCQVLLEKQLPRLTDEELSDGELYDLLLEIGEELRHVLYHIDDPRFFDYLKEETTEAGVSR